MRDSRSLLYERVVYLRVFLTRIAEQDPLDSGIGVDDLKQVGVLEIIRIERFLRAAEGRTEETIANACKRTGVESPARSKPSRHSRSRMDWPRLVTLWTHAIRGLHRNDFIMAAKIDSLVAAPQALYCGLRISGLPIASRKMAFLCFACGEKKLTTSSSKKVKPVAPRRWA